MSRGYIGSRDRELALFHREHCKCKECKKWLEDYYFWEFVISISIVVILFTVFILYIWRYL